MNAIPDAPALPRLRSIREIAEAAGVSELTILREIKRGNLAVIRIGRRTLIHPDDWRAYLDRRCARRATKAAP